MSALREILEVLGEGNWSERSLTIRVDKDNRCVKMRLSEGKPPYELCYDFSILEREIHEREVDIVQYSIHNASRKLRHYKEEKESIKNEKEKEKEGQ